MNSTTQTSSSNPIETLERWTIGRALCAARIPFALLTTIGLIIKIAVKTLILKPIQLLIDYAKDNKNIIKLERSIQIDRICLKMAATDVLINFKRVITAPSEENYKKMNFNKAMAKWATAVFTDEISLSGY